MIKGNPKDVLREQKMQLSSALDFDRTRIEEIILYFEKNPKIKVIIENDQRACNFYSQTKKDFSFTFCKKGTITQKERNFNFLKRSLEELMDVLIEHFQQHKLESN